MLRTYIDASSFKYAIQRQWLCDGGNWIVYRQDVWFKIFSFELTYWKNVGMFSHDSEARYWIEQDIKNKQTTIAGI